MTDAKAEHWSKRWGLAVAASIASAGLMYYWTTSRPDLSATVDYGNFVYPPIIERKIRDDREAFDKLVKEMRSLHASVRAARGKIRRQINESELSVGELRKQIETTLEEEEYFRQLIPGDEKTAEPLEAGAVQRHCALRA